MKRHTSKQTVVNKKAVVFESVYQNINLSETQISRYCTIKKLDFIGPSFDYERHERIKQAAQKDFLDRIIIRNKEMPN